MTVIERAMGCILMLHCLILVLLNYIAANGKVHMNKGKE